MRALRKFIRIDTQLPSLTELYHASYLDRCMMMYGVHIFSRLIASPCLRKCDQISFQANIVGSHLNSRP